MKRGLFLVLALAAVSVASAAGVPLRIVVYHTNDIHGWIMPRPDKVRPERLAGGAAALASVIAKETEPKLIVDAGDWWQGTPEGSLTKGEALAEVFNAIGYDALAVGNHEYDAGVGSLRALIGKMKAPVLSANTYGTDGKRVSWVKPWVIKDVAGVKVGLFGLTTAFMPRLAFAKNIEGLHFRREVDEARETVSELKRAGAEVVIVLSHLGYEEEGRPKFEGDQTLAREVPGIDLIVGSHSHTVLNRPVRDPVNKTLIVQAGSYLLRVGRATLTIEPKTHRVLASEDELIELWPDRAGEDVRVKAIVDKQVAVAGKIFEMVVATAAASLTREAARESGLGSWMADCYKDWAGVDAAFQNGGGIRADISPGPVTLRTLYSVMPFDNALVKLKMKGAVLREILEHGVGLARILQIGGPSVVFRRGKPFGERLVSAEVGGSPIEDGKTYSVATLDFIVSGGDGYNAFDRADSRELTGILARDVLRRCAEKQKTVVPPPAGRLKIKED